MSAIDRVIDSENTKLCRIESEIYFGCSDVYNLQPLFTQSFIGVPVYGLNGNRIGTANLVPIGVPSRRIELGNALGYQMTASIDYQTPDRLALDVGDSLFASMSFVVDADTPMTNKCLDLGKKIRVNKLLMVVVTLERCSGKEYVGVVRLQDA